jgi:hydroxymethylglutaryl-CoA lyase
VNDLPRLVRINEEGPILTARKIALIDSLSETCLRQIQWVSFVNPKNVPGWADAEAVAAGFRKREGVTDGGR